MPESSHITNGNDFKEYLDALESQELTEKDTELIRRYRQVSFAVLGYDDSVYPCIKESPFSEADMETATSNEHNGDSSGPPQARVGGTKVSRWESSGNTSNHDREMLFCFQKMLRSSNDPASFHADATEAKLTKIMCSPRYLDVFSHVNADRLATLRGDETKDRMAVEQDADEDITGHCFRLEECDG